MARTRRQDAAIERQNALHVRACSGDVEAMRALAYALLGDFDEEHFNPSSKRHVADLQALLTDPVAQAAARALPVRPKASARRNHALYWLREAARQGDAEAGGTFASLLFRAGAPFHAASLDAFEDAARLGDLPSMLALGRTCWHGCEGASPDRTRASTWLHEARARLEAAAGRDDAFAVHALVDLGQMCLRGEACAVDVAATLRLWQQAAARGHARAMRLIGDLYADGRVVAFDADAAAQWYGRALAAGDSFANHALLRLAAVRTQRLRRAEWQAHALAGDAHAALQLARGFETGADGGDLDVDEAATWYRVAARRGHPLGMVETGKRLAAQSSPAAQGEAWFWLQLAQRAPWSQAMPAAALLASAAADRLSRQLATEQRRSIDAAVVAVRPDAEGWIDPPALG